MNAFSDDIENIITARYRSGESRQELADDFYCSPATIANIARRHGYKRGRGNSGVRTFQPSAGERRMRVVADYNCGIPLAVIAKCHGFATRGGVTCMMRRAETAGVVVNWRRPRTEKEASHERV